MRVCLLALVFAACSGTSPLGQVAGTLDGFVYLASPVGGVVVTAYSYDLEADTQGMELAHSEPSAADGAFHLDLGIAFGPVLLVARGNGASYVEPSTGARVTWDAAQELRAVWTAWLPTNDLGFDFERGTTQSALIIGPFSHLAMTVARARQRAVSGTSFAVTLKNVYLLFRDHLEVDYWSLPPVDLTSGDSRTWVAPVQAGLEYAGLSQLAARIAESSATGGISSLQLLGALERDAKDGVLDGRGLDGALTLGACMRECNLSGRTLRAEWADSMALYLASTNNHSTLTPNAVNDFLVRVATRHSDLFLSDATDAYDVTPPTITVVESSVIDQSAGNTATPLRGDVTATFGRYSDDYGPASVGIPKWHFFVEDDRSDPSNLSVEARLLRSSDQSELVPWFAVPLVIGGGYNREVVVSTALYTDLATQSGAYQLEVRAKDEKGNAAPATTVTWEQTILAPLPPTITVVDNTATDETPLVVSVTDGGPVYSGAASDVALNASTTPSFGRYASHFGPSDSGIPKWRFLVSDTHSDPATVDVEVRLLRSGAELVSWFKAPPVAGSGYNREVVVSSALHSDLATVSGDYSLELKATNDKGYQSSLTVVGWRQTVLAPPVRQRAAPACNAASDGACPAHYSLQGSLDAAVPISGIGLPSGTLRIGHLYIDNPNPAAVRVNIQASASLLWSRGRIGWINAYNNAWPYTPGCMPDQSNDGSCYTAPTVGAEDVAAGQSISSVPVSLHVFVGGSEIGVCSGCAASERELPANTTAEVWIHSGPYSFLWGPYTLGVLNNSNFPSWAIGSPAEQWVRSYKFSSGGFGQLYIQTWWYLTRLAVWPNVTTTLRSRPADSRASLVAATGTNITNFPATTSIWSTSAPAQGGF